MISQSADNQKRQEEMKREERRRKKEKRSGSAEIVRGSVNIDEYQIIGGERRETEAMETKRRNQRQI